jgi:hypothetical protein
LVRIIGNDIPKTGSDGYKQITFRAKIMNNARPPGLNFTLFLGALAGLVLTFAPPLFASAENEIDSALSTSKAWTSQIDAGQYDESYVAGSQAMHDKIAQDRWDEVLKALRSPWGAVLSRKQVSHVYRPNGFEGAEGEFMVITYDTSFQKLNEATEVVVLKWEDGKWRGAGYNARAKAPDDGSAPTTAPESTTEIQTEDHVKPQAPSP